MCATEISLRFGNIINEEFIRKEMNFLIKMFPKNLMRYFMSLISFIPNKLRPEFISFLNSLFFTWIAEINWCMHYLHIRNLSWYFTCSCVYVTRLNIPITEQGLVKIGDAKPEYLQCIYNTRVNAMHPLYIKREYKLLQLVHIQYPTTRILAAMYPQAKIREYMLNTRTVPSG